MLSSTAEDGKIEVQISVGLLTALVAQSITQGIAMRCDDSDYEALRKELPDKSQKRIYFMTLVPASAVPLQWKEKSGCSDTGTTPAPTSRSPLSPRPQGTKFIRALCSSPCPT
uniref:Uncharacterized protein n=1 Tax=Timema genevievae TaxID=629358 RepID=A0A7R9PPR8_TIMGE|nr:unnamed protein product [Timema genevievae]